MQLRAVGLGDVRLRPLRAGRRRVGERAAGSSRAAMRARAIRMETPTHAGPVACGRWGPPRTRTRRARPPRLPEPRTRRAVGRRPLGRRPSGAHARGARRGLRGRACATSTRPARTGAPRSSWASGCASRQPDGVTISSKWGYVYTAGWEVAADPPEVKHHDVETFRRQLDETREHLGDWLALYQIHSATPDSGVLSNDAVLTRDGRVRPPARRERQRRVAGRDDRPRGVARDLQRRPGDVEPARARRRGRAGRAAA